MLDGVIDLLQCPECKAGSLKLDSSGAPEDLLSCESCDGAFPVREGVPLLVPQSSPLAKTAFASDGTGAPVGDTAESDGGMGTDTARQAEYWEADSWYREVDHPVVEWFSRQRWDYIQQMLPLEDVKTALDVGAGNGASTKFAPDSMEIVATDGAWRMLRRHPGDSRIVADVMALPFQDRRFDLVYCWELLHHIDEPWRALTEMARVTRRWVLIFEPNPINLAQFLFSLYDREHRWVLRFSKSYLLDQVRQAGLKPVAYRRGGLLFPNKSPQALSAVLRRLPYRIPFMGISQVVLAELSD